MRPRAAVGLADRRGAAGIARKIAAVVARIAGAGRWGLRRSLGVGRSPWGIGGLVPLGLGVC